jgi:hypothetical protein
MVLDRFGKVPPRPVHAQRLHTTASSDLFAADSLMGCKQPRVRKRAAQRSCVAIGNAPSKHQRPVRCVAVGNTAGSETPERCTDTASSRYGGANGRLLLSPLPSFSLLRSWQLPLRASSPRSTPSALALISLAALAPLSLAALAPLSLAALAPLSLAALAPLSFAALLSLAAPLSLAALALLPLAALALLSLAALAPLSLAALDPLSLAADPLSLAALAPLSLAVFAALAAWKKMPLKTQISGRRK